MMKKTILAASAFLFLGAAALPGCYPWWHHHRQHHDGGGYRHDGGGHEKESFHRDQWRDERRGESGRDRNSSRWDGNQRYAANDADRP